MSKTKIEWATHTSNWLAGCSKVSGACTFCYAETMSGRLATMPSAPARYRDGVVRPGGGWTGRVSYDPEALRRTFEGLRNARKPRRVFINSMSDTFHEDAPPQSLTDLASAIRTATQDKVGKAGHVIMLLTKRVDRMLAWQREHFPNGLPSWVWVGCTVEDQKRADERIPVLLQVKASVRYLSMEPLLGPVNLHLKHALAPDMFEDDPLAMALMHRSIDDGLAWARSGIHWVIDGGESGKKARITNPDWFRSLRDQCAAAGVPYMHKQNGEWMRADQAARLPVGAIALTAREKWVETEGSRGAQLYVRVGKRAAGNHLDGVQHLEVPRG